MSNLGSFSHPPLCFSFVALAMAFAPSADTAGKPSSQHSHGLPYVPYQRRRIASARFPETHVSRASSSSPLKSASSQNGERRATGTPGNVASTNASGRLRSPTLRVVTMPSLNTPHYPHNISRGGSPPPLRRISAATRHSSGESTPERNAHPRCSFPDRDEWDALRKSATPSPARPDLYAISEPSLSRSETPVRSVRTTPSPTKDSNGMKVPRPLMQHHSYAATIALTNSESEPKDLSSMRDSNERESRHGSAELRQRPYRTGFQPKGVSRPRTEEFMIARNRRRGAVELEEQRMERRLAKLAAIHCSALAGEYGSNVAPSAGFFLRGSSGILDLFQSKQDSENQRRLQRLRASEQSVVKWQDDTAVQNCNICG